MDAVQNRAGVNPWLMMAFMAIPVFVGSLDLTVVSAFLPELVIDLGLPFDTGIDDASWIITGYLLAYTVSLTFTGRLSDLLGRRLVYTTCLVIFIIGSMIIATLELNPMNPEDNLLYMFYRRIGQRPDIAYVNLQIIIFGRIVQALGAGALVPVSLALVGDLFPPDQRARPLGLVAAMDTLGWVLGHLYGALFLQIEAFEG
ncbi:MAG: MFS transporter, partial [Aggregatilineales bacterium]